MPAPVSSVTNDYDLVERGSYRGSYYKVEKGDTLYFIAYITAKDVNDIIAANNLSAPYIIHPGQKLNLWKDTYTPPKFGKNDKNESIVAKVKPPAASAEKTTKDPNVLSQKKSEIAPEIKKGVEYKKTKEYSHSVTKNKPSVDQVVKTQPKTSKSILWQWPSRGRIISGFSSQELGNKGIDIAGPRGQNITAAADGKVVYAGNALRGYGNLIIIKHNDDYLSAYAHNERILVSERQQVKQGQKIATMGSSATNSVRLHFEIRYKGKSVNPLRHLPKR